MYLKSCTLSRGTRAVSWMAFLWHNGNTLQNVLITNPSRLPFANTAGSKVIPHLPWRPSWGDDCWCHAGFCTRAPRCYQSGRGCLWGWFPREDCSTGRYTRPLDGNKNQAINTYFYPFLTSLSFTPDAWGHSSLQHPPISRISWMSGLAAKTLKRSKKHSHNEGSYTSLAF